MSSEHCGAKDLLADGNNSHNIIFSKHFCCSTGKPVKRYYIGRGFKPQIAFYSVNRK